MFFLKILSSLIPFTFILIITGCDLVDSPTASLSGKIYSYDYLPVSNLKVIVQDQIVYSSDDGRFSFNNVSVPYDIVVVDSLSRKAVVYKGLSERVILLPYSGYGNNNGQATLKVHLPRNIFQLNTKCKIIFTDGNFINQYIEVSQYVPDIFLHIPVQTDFVTGNLIVLTYKINSANKILSYENYGESPDIQLRQGIISNYTFDSLDLSLNPGEQNIDGSLNIIPDNYSTSFYLSFGSKNLLFNDTYQTFSILSGSIFSFKIPTGISRPFFTYVKNSNSSNSGYAIEDFSVYPNSSNNLAVKIPPALISPQTGFKNVSNSTQFSFNSGSGTGVYEISLENNSRYTSYKIITTDNNFTLAGLEDLGLGNINNNYFNWNVKKTGPANSLNDYVKNYFDQPNHFISQSETRFFSTEP